MPVSRLNERPTREGTLVDITCDSDGEVKKFIDLSDVRDTLPAARAARPTATARSLITSASSSWAPTRTSWAICTISSGASTKSMSSSIPTKPAGYYVEEIIEGSTIVQALTSVQYDENELKRQMKMQIDEAIKSDRLKPSEGMRLLDDYERGLKEYTYLAI